VKLADLVRGARLWDSGEVARQARDWVEAEGRALLDLPASQVAALLRACSKGKTADECRAALSGFLGKQAKKEKRPGCWTLLLKDLPAALEEAWRAVQRPARREREEADVGLAFARSELVLAKRGETVDRKLEVWREFMGAVAKLHRSRDEWRKEEEA